MDDVPVVFRCAYTVGVKNDGALIFEPSGQQPGLIELLGLHSYAGERIRELLTASRGDPALTAIHNLEAALAKYLQTLNTLVANKPA